MRIFLFMPKAVRNQPACEELYSSLTKVLEENPDVVLTKENPDVIHVFGCWHYGIARIINNACRKKIPVILSPLGELQPWWTNNNRLKRNVQTACYQKDAVAKATAIIVGGEMEKECIERLTCNKNIFIVRNSAVTQSISSHEMGIEIIKKYQEAIVLFDLNIWASIKKEIEKTGERDNTVINICSKILYIRYLLERENIPLSILNDLSSTMTESNYDEARMEVLLKELGIHDFTACLEKVAADRSTLTEGFMPIMWKQTKLTSRIDQKVTDYNSQ